jgi:hypothetical protein
MSALSKAFIAKETGHAVEYPFNDILSYSSKITELDLPRTYRYNVEAVFKTRITATKNELEYLFPEAKKILIELIFGEFRPLLAELQLAIYDRNFNDARLLLHKLHKEMFGDE